MSGLLQKTEDALHGRNRHHGTNKSAVQEQNGVQSHNKKHYNADSDCG